MTRVLVKCGGAASRLAPEQTILALAEAGDEVCVVHGAGPQISDEMTKRGLDVEFVEGRRVTTPEALEVVRESMAAVNARLCGAIGERAVPLWGDEVGLAASHEPALGRVGNALPSRPPAVVAALDAGQIPVVVPLASGPLNVNADEMAVALAEGLEADRLLFVTDVPGLLQDDEVVSTLGVDEADALLASGALEGGIVPKLRAAVAAARLHMTAEIGATTIVSDTPRTADHHEADQLKGASG